MYNVDVDISMGGNLDVDISIGGNLDVDISIGGNLDVDISMGGNLDVGNRTSYLPNVVCKKLKAALAACTNDHRDSSRIRRS
jgi:hypothetical protein